MANISEEKWIEMLEKKADGSYIAKYPKVKSKSGTTFDEHLAEKASLTKLGHVKAETDEDGKLILDMPKSNYNATRRPTKEDDKTKGYSEGSFWFIVTDDIKIGYVCIDSTNDHAKWTILDTEISQLLYDRGDEFIETTGGWSAVDRSQTTLTKRVDSLRYSFSATSSTPRGIFATANKIDFGGISNITVKVNNISGNRIIIQLTEEIDRDIIASATLSSTDGDLELELDTSNLNGSYHVRLRGERFSSNAGTLNVTEVKLT